MYIKLDKNNYIERFELVEITAIENFIKLDDSKIDFLFDENKILKKEFYSEYKFYTYKNATLIKDLKKQNSCELEEQKDYYLKKSLEIGKKLEEYKNIGLQGGQEYIDLEKELEVNKNKYIELCQTEAIKIDEHMNSTKPAK